jgi:hypothetical protein
LELSKLLPKNVKPFEVFYNGHTLTGHYDESKISQWHISGNQNDLSDCCLRMFAMVCSVIVDLDLEISPGVPYPLTPEGLLNLHPSIVGAITLGIANAFTGKMPTYLAKLLLFGEE